MSRKGGTRSRPRTDEAVRHALGSILAHDVADPRIGMVTVTDVRVTQDLSYATVYYTTMDDDPAEAAEALDHARPHIQRLLAQEVRLRKTPQLRFEADPVRAQAARVEALLRQVHERDADD